MPKITLHLKNAYFSSSWDFDKTSPAKGDRANYQSIRWTPLTTLLLKTMYMTSPISMQCNQSDGNRFQVSLLAYVYELQYYISKMM
jgi:hypothetical protein